MQPFAVGGIEIRSDRLPVFIAQSIIPQVLRNDTGQWKVADASASGEQSRVSTGCSNPEKSVASMEIPA
jgi:hypothetical protein